MDSKLKEIFHQNAISEDVRKTVESAGWTTIRLAKVFSSDSDAKDKAAAKFKFAGEPDEEVTAAKISLAWEDAVSAAKTLKQEKEDAHAPSEGPTKRLVKSLRILWRSSGSQLMTGRRPQCKPKAPQPSSGYYTRR